MKEICQMSNNDAVQLNQDGSWREVENRNENIDEIGLFVVILIIFLVVLLWQG